MKKFARYVFFLFLLMVLNGCSDTMWLTAETRTDEEIFGQIKRDLGIEIHGTLTQIDDWMARDPHTLAYVKLDDTLLPEDLSSWQSGSMPDDILTGISIYEQTLPVMNEMLEIASSDMIFWCFEDQSPDGYAYHDFIIGIYDPDASMLYYLYMTT